MISLSGGEDLIKNILVDGSVSQDNYLEFMNHPKINAKLSELYNQVDCNYIIGIDVADKDSKDYSCMAYYKEDKNGDLVLVGIELIK